MKEFNDYPNTVVMTHDGKLKGGYNNYVCFANLRYKADNARIPPDLAAAFKAGETPWLGYMIKYPVQWEAIKKVYAVSPFLQSMAELHEEPEYLVDGVKCPYGKTVGCYLARLDMVPRYVLWNLCHARWYIDYPGAANSFDNLIEADVHPLVAMWVSRYMQTDGNTVRYQRNQGGHSPVPDEGGTVAYLKQWLKRAKTPYERGVHDEFRKAGCFNSWGGMCKWVGIGDKEAELRDPGFSFEIEMMSNKLKLTPEELNFKIAKLKWGDDRDFLKLTSLQLKKEVHNMVETHELEQLV